MGKGKRLVVRGGGGGKREERRARGVSFPVSLWNRLRERAEKETGVNGYYVSSTQVMIRAINAELKKPVGRG